MECFLNCEDLEKMKTVDLKSVNCKELVDIRDVRIDENADVSERVLQFIQQVKNPYCFKVGNVAVKVSYKEQGASFQKNFEDMILAL